MIRKLLVPTDGSEHARSAIALAADIAGKYDAEIVILHVLMHHASAYDLKPLCADLKASDDLIARLDDLIDTSLEASSAGYGGPVILPAPTEILEEIGKLVCDDGKLRAESAGVSKVASHVVSGSPADAILDAAEKENADMIVMGSRGLGKVADLLMGSVSHKVSHLSKCTCVTVK